MTVPVSTHDVRMSSWSAVGLVASRELSTRLRSKAYVITTVVMLVLIVGVSLVVKLLSGGGADTTVGFTGQTAALSAPAGQRQGDRRKCRHDAGRGRNGRASEGSDGSLDALLVGDGRNIEIVVKKDLDGKLKNALNALAGQLALNRQVIELGGDPARVSAVVAGARAEIRPMEQPYDYNKQQLALGINAGILIYLSLLMNANR